MRVERAQRQGSARKECEAGAVAAAAVCAYARQPCAAWRAAASSAKRAQCGAKIWLAKMRARQTNEREKKDPRLIVVRQIRAAKAEVTMMPSFRCFFHAQPRLIYMRECRAAQR